MKVCYFSSMLLVIFTSNLLFAQKKAFQKINIEILDTTSISGKLYLIHLGEGIIDSATSTNKKIQFTIKKNNYPRYVLSSNKYEYYVTSFVSDFKKDINIKIHSFDENKDFHY